MSEWALWDGRWPLRHYSHEPLGTVESKEQVRKDGSPARFKPVGLWVSVETGKQDGWAEWCDAEEFDGDWEYVYEVTADPAAHVLHLRHADEILRFTREFASRDDCYNCRWDDVASQWDGIIIAPYCWALRLDHRTSWYYPWDCASGCIWNADAVASLKALEVRC